MRLVAVARNVFREFVVNSGIIGVTRGVRQRSGSAIGKFPQLDKNFIPGDGYLVSVSH